MLHSMISSWNLHVPFLDCSSQLFPTRRTANLYQCKPELFFSKNRHVLTSACLSVLTSENIWWAGYWIAHFWTTLKARSCECSLGHPFVLIQLIIICMSNVNAAAAWPKSADIKLDHIGWAEFHFYQYTSRRRKFACGIRCWVPLNISLLAQQYIYLNCDILHYGCKLK